MKALTLATVTLCGLIFASAGALAQTTGQGASTSSEAQQANREMKSAAQGGVAMSHQASAMGQQATPGGAQIAPSKVYGDILRLFEQQIIGAAEAMPEDNYNFAPSAQGNFAGVRTFAQEVKHLTSANYMFYRDFGIGPAPDKAKLDAMTSKADIVQGLKDSFAYAEKGVETITPENAFIGLTTGKHSETRAGNATFSIAHAMDHYGQMVEYLRMNGIVPPASQRK